MKITIVAGARPNFMKVSPIIKALEKKNESVGKFIDWELVHTGQHFDEKMSKTFFHQLNIPEPTVNLNAGGGTQAEQTANIMVRFEKYLMEREIDLVLVVGDVNSTMACTIVAKKMGIRVAHVEAGIRSGDLSMPEEINRIVTDSITDLFFTTTKEANQHLLSKGFASEKIHWVGNTMIDTLTQNLKRVEPPNFWKRQQIKREEYIVITLHRPANVDEAKNLHELLSQIIQHSGNKKLIFPIHPRTRKNIDFANFDEKKIFFCDPLGYLEFIYLIKNSLGVITDSGGITEETTYLNIPCMTLRDNTERPETVTIGTNELIGTNPDSIGPYLRKMIGGEWKKGGIPEKWDGKASERIIDIIASNS